MAAAWYPWIGEAGKAGDVYAALQVVEDCEDIWNEVDDADVTETLEATAPAASASQVFARRTVPLAALIGFFGFSSMYIGLLAIRIPFYPVLFYIG